MRIIFNLHISKLFVTKHFILKILTVKIIVSKIILFYSNMQKSEMKVFSKIQKLGKTFEYVFFNFLFNKNN